MEEEKIYQQLLHEREINKIRIHDARRILHNAYVVRNKKMLMVTDIFMILIFFFNMVTLGISNFLITREVIQKNISITFLETNPLQAKINNFKQYPKFDIIKSYIIQSFTWILFFGVYSWKRFVIINDEEYALLGIMVIVLLVFVGKDFINNLGFFIGKIWR